MNNTTNDILQLVDLNATNNLLIRVINQTHNITNMQLEQTNTLIYILYVVIAICVFLMIYVFLQLLNLVASAAWR
jgi:hypothetical protein